MENVVSGKWTELKTEVMKAWSAISHEELDKTSGNLQALVSLVQEKIGLAREEAATRLIELAVLVEGDQEPTSTEPTKH